MLLFIYPISGCSFTASPFVGARRHFHSFLIPVPYGGSPPRLQCGQVCRTAILLFCRRRFYRQADAQIVSPILHPFERTFAKILALPYYRIIIWMKNKRKPLQGIRQIDQQNIDVVFNMVKKTAHTKINSSLIQDIEVAMLPKQSTAVINYLNRIHKKKP
ncbi:MAG: hypothetical protein IPP39_15185 [Chitinophagaceae bacterium]|nr:hypothetical protein [Chitinophagaceae bacterium]